MGFEPMTSAIPVQCSKMSCLFEMINQVFSFVLVFYVFKFTMNKLQAR